MNVLRLSKKEMINLGLAGMIRSIRWDSLRGFAGIRRARALFCHCHPAIYEICGMQVMGFRWFIYDIDDIGKRYSGDDLAPSKLTKTMVKIMENHHIVHS